jgi:AcrR family transcriptional regulator
MSSGPGTQEKRRVGRPRKRAPSEVDGDPKEQILKAAARLFGERGIAEVSMLEIADGAGLGQSSLYYWYRRKELIVAELLQQINRVPLAYARQLKADGKSADVQLYSIVRFDVLNVCQFPLEITEVHRFARRERAAFEVYWQERRELVRTIQRIVESGIASGCFRSVDAYLCALTIIAQDESVQNWHSIDRSALTDRASGGAQAGIEPAALRYAVEEIADFVASQTLASLLAADSRLQAVRRRALKHSGQRAGAEGSRS